MCNDHSEQFLAEMGTHTHAYKTSESFSQPFPALCDPVDSSPPGSLVRGALQAKILEWVAIPFSGGSSPSRD